MQILLGFSALAVIFGAFVYFTNNQYKARRFKHDHPVVCVAAVLAAGYLVVYMFGAVLVFIFGIAFPMLSKYYNYYTQTRGGRYAMIYRGGWVISQTELQVGTYFFICGVVHSVLDSRSKAVTQLTDHPSQV